MAIESKMPRCPIGQAGEVKGQRHFVLLICISILFVAVIIGGLWFYYSDSDAFQVQSPSEKGGVVYQAVFLDNGQVYFGTLDRADDELYHLTNVYYLQSGTMVDQSANLALTKLGSEAHGPEDIMIINIDHVLFIENLREDSKVVQAILQFNTNQVK